MENIKEINHLLWIDCEMTGLNPHQDEILELACVLTNAELEPVFERSWIFFQPEEILATMSPFCRQMYDPQQSDLLEKIKSSKVTYESAEKEVASLLAQHTKRNHAFLAGNSIWNDRNFLARCMPRIIEWLHYRLLDISTLKLLMQLQYPNKAPFPKTNKHRALEDIHESIEEFRWYQQELLVSKG